MKIPEPIGKLKFIDVHCHLPFPRPVNDSLPSYEEQYNNFFKSGGIYLISCAIDLTTLKLILKFIKNKENIGWTNGWSPQFITSTSKDKYKKDWEEWINYTLNNSEDYIAIGEIGLDFHLAKTLLKRNRQIEEFKKILELTIDLDKPYIIHMRNDEHNKKNPEHRFDRTDGAIQEILKILKDYKINPRKVMWHCFYGPEKYGRLLTNQGFMLSVPSSAFRKSNWRDSIKGLSIDNLLTETDSFYQHPFERGAFNVPSNARYSIAAIAFAQNRSQIEVSEKTINNAIKFFNLDLNKNIIKLEKK